jgi:acetone carboxylase gamma subunit
MMCPTCLAQEDSQVHQYACVLPFTLNADNAKLRAEVESCKRQLQEWYGKLQGADANWAEAEKKLKDALLQVSEYQAAVRKVDKCCGCLNYEPFKDLDRGKKAEKTLREVP